MHGRPMTLATHFKDIWRVFVYKLLEREETTQRGTWCLLENSKHNNPSSKKTTSFTPKYAYSDNNLC